MQAEQSELQQVLTSISDLKTEFTDLKTEFTDLKKDVETFNTKFDNYQKSTQQIVNLAFSLIASATILSIVYRVFPR